MINDTTAAMHDADARILRAEVVQCTRDAFAACSIDVDLDEGDPCPPAHEAQIVAFIGFGGARLRGTLTVMAPQQLWQMTYPIAVTRGVEPGDHDLLDWCSELVNQLLGRIKNRLTQRGVDLEVSTPKALHANQLTISRSAQRSVCILRSRGNSGSTIGVWFDAVAASGGTLFDSPSEAPPRGDAEESMSEGDLVLF